MQENPFKFGRIVNDPFFTNRKKEMKLVRALLSSSNNLIMISPRRYGKTSLINKVIKELKRPYIMVDLQLVTSSDDLAAQIIKRLFRLFPFEHIKQYVKNFRIIPSITLNPLSNEVDISFQPSSSSTLVMEDAINLIEQLSSPKKRIIAVFDEFQEIKLINSHLDRQLRSLMQHHKKVNYVFLGSQESIIRDIFEKKKSPFYHFGQLIPLGKIPYEDFYEFLSSKFKQVCPAYDQITASILEITQCHPYYTQQLAFFVWELYRNPKPTEDPVGKTVSELIRLHDMDYERLWNTLNKTDIKILIGMASSDLSPLSEAFSQVYQPGASSTIFSALKRLARDGFILKSTSGYEIDDPFFKRWITQRRNR